MVLTDPPLRAEPPADGVRAFRCSVACGVADHPRQVLERRDLDALDLAERAWRCPTCGRPAGRTP